MWQYFCSGSIKGGATLGPIEHFSVLLPVLLTCWVIHVLALVLILLTSGDPS